MKGPLSQIRVSLVTSLGAGQIIFLAGIGATENKVKLLIHLPIRGRSRFTISSSVTSIRPMVHLLSPLTGKLCSLAGNVCCSSSSCTVLLYGSFLLDARGGNLPLLVCCSSLQR